MTQPLLRKARIGDAKAIHGLLLNPGEGDGMVLPRSFNQIYSHLRDFFVVADRDTGAVLGCCALSICWDNLAEIRSLMVRNEARGRGLGRLLVDACLSEAVTLGIFRVFVLTNQEAFFKKMGFEDTGKDTLPQKVWADCVNCTKFPDCDEVAMIMEL
ncbi:MAG TPA: N-acetyltransferase [Desulfovibrio sp.]|jgi:amino-acid N-acetyltransferase|uniref:N-acetyltransferase n=1 Tax=Desulfovibrio TaxID=872 RepID=UPI00042346E1|nr:MULTISPECIES: N-acetyltransferase [Desulfovibrio]MDY0305707.1 N-acetyltransferase [Desulfovibrionaceae bacterium]HMM40157.1 N-acetyltransferase [Desulfovibrio sp.]